MELAIRKLQEHIGAEVEGVDITAPIDESIFAQLRSALYQNSVLVFRGQNINDEQHVAFTRGFGPIELTIPNDPIGDGGPVGILSNLDENGAVIPPQDTRMLYQRGNELWHSDGAFRRVPLRASLLSAKVVPPEGGETEYAGLCAAYAALPAGKESGRWRDWPPSTTSPNRGRKSLPTWSSDAFLARRCPRWSMRWCAPFPKPEPGRSSSDPIPRASSAGLSKRGGPCCRSCWNGPPSRDSSTGTIGAPTTWWSGTTAAACTGDGPGTGEPTAASCTAPPWPATVPPFPDARSIMSRVRPWNRGRISRSGRRSRRYSAPARVREWAGRCRCSSTSRR